jgi:hypothetical protein
MDLGDSIKNHASFHIRDDYGDKMLTDAFEIHFISMYNFRRLRKKV